MSFALGKPCIAGDMDTERLPQIIPKLTEEINADHTNTYQGTGIELGQLEWNEQS